MSQVEFYNPVELVVVPSWLERLLDQQGLSPFSASDTTLLNRILSKDDVVFYTLFREAVETFINEKIIDKEYSTSTFKVFNPDLDLIKCTDYSSNRSLHIKTISDMSFNDKVRYLGGMPDDRFCGLEATYRSGKVFVTVINKEVDTEESCKVLVNSLYDAVSRIWTITDLAKTKLFDLKYKNLKVPTGHMSI